ncbi:MAG: methylmalonyl-CoA mutase [Betaproteobacteria bacterium]|nr:methylmalonyl-CoA mutase [Betaproteobacteria bacterium]
MASPDSFPFVRGVHPTGYRGKMWTRRPITGFNSPARTNERVRQLLRSGQTGLHFVFDYPTLGGYDADHPLAEGEIGVSGVPMNTLDDMRTLLEGIDLERVSLSYSHWGPYVLSFLLALADERGVPYERISGTTQGDVLMYYHSCPWWDLPLRANMKLFVDVAEFAAQRMPRWNPISISGYNIRDGGCSAVQEMAFTFGDAIAYLDACLERGLTAAQVAPRLSFMLCAHIDFFEEICKMRAMRRMWAHIIRDRYHCDLPQAQALRFHAQTSGVALTAEEPLNNIARGAIQALAAVLGGAQSLHISCFDETYGLPTEQAARVSLNTQNIIAFEALAGQTVDPLGGSYFLETRTNELEQLAWAMLREIDDQGGMVNAAEAGWVRERKLAWARQYQREVESKERIIVGVNEFVSGEPQSIPYMRPDEQAQREQKERTQAFKRNRDQARASAAQAALREAAASGANVMPAAIRAARDGVTLGEMYETMRAVFGEVPAAEKRFM